VLLLSERAEIKEKKLLISIVENRSHQRQRGSGRISSTPADSIA